MKTLNTKTAFNKLNRKALTQQAHLQIPMHDVVFVAELDGSESLKEDLPRFLFLQTLHVEDQI